MRRYRKYPKNNFDLLFINIGYEINNYGADEYIANFQEFVQFEQIFKHKLSVMQITPPFNDRQWYENNFQDIRLYIFPINCGKADKYILNVYGNTFNDSYTCPISGEMYRVLKNHKNILFVYYEGNIIDLLPCPESEDVDEFNRYNYEKNQTGEQMRYLRILYSQVEEDIDSDWARYSGDIEKLLLNAYEYQNRKYEFASDGSVSLISDDEIDAFIKRKESEIESGMLISFYPSFKTRFGKHYVHLSNPDIKDIEYKMPVTKVFMDVFKDIKEIVFCVIDFEVKDIIPIYDK